MNDNLDDIFTSYGKNVYLDVVGDSDFEAYSKASSVLGSYVASCTDETILLKYLAECKDAMSAIYEHSDLTDTDGVLIVDFPTMSEFSSGYVCDVLSDNVSKSVLSKASLSMDDTNKLCNIGFFPDQPSPYFEFLYKAANLDNISEKSVDSELNVDTTNQVESEYTRRMPKDLENIRVKDESSKKEISL